MTAGQLATISNQPGPEQLLICSDCAGDGVLVLAYLDLTGVWVPSSGDLQQSSPPHIRDSEGAHYSSSGKHVHWIRERDRHVNGK